MKRILLAVLVFVFCLPSFAQTVFQDYQDGVIYVKINKESFKSIALDNPFSISAGKLPLLRNLIGTYGITKVSRPFFQAKDDETLPYVLKVTFTKKSQVLALIETLSKMNGVEYAEKIPIMRVDAVPNDPLWAATSGSAHLNQIGAQNAWNVFNGSSNISVAIVDNAVMWNHVDLQANVFVNAAETPSNGIDDDGNGYVDDVNGWDVSDNDNNAVPTNSLMDHGTHCAGIAAGVTNNTVGIASIGWNIKFIPVKCQTNNGLTNIVANGYEGIVYSVKAKAKIISCSWGGTGSSTTEQAVINYAWNRGSIVMAAAGNSNVNTLTYPGAYTNVYCVASINPSDVKSSFSNFGTWIDICAPGNSINSTVPYTVTPAYVQKSGTSMATPLVAGLAGLMLAKSPNMTQTDVLNCINSTAVNIYTLTGNATYSTGNQLGIGRIDAFAAMNCAATYSALPPVANFYANLLNTCPNTPIIFSDSSLYQPTSWNWVFQGGTPGTSTLTNPSVQWTTPGTYSVSLTASNASGNNTKTKLAYITISGPSALPFFEGFQATQFVPANWTINNIMNDNIFWQRKTGVGGFGTSTACAMFDNYNLNAPNERDEIRSPRFSFSNVASARLRFDVAYARYDATFSDTMEVKVSTNCGASWTSIYLKGGTQLSTAPDMTGQFVPSGNQWRRDSIDISTITAGQGNVMFSFINRGRYGQAIYLDNINLVFPTPTIAIAAMGTVCTGAALVFTNTSSGAGSYTWTLPGATPGNSVGSNYTTSFSNAGSYTLTLQGVNGTSSAQTTATITVAASPTLGVSSTSICSGSVANLTVTGASTYSWNTGSTNSVIAVTPATTTVYTVTGNTGGACFANGTASVFVTATPTLAIANQTICSGASTSLSANGATSYSWSTGSTAPAILVTPTVTTSYTVTGFNAGCVGSATVTVTIGPGLSVSLTPVQSAICAGSTTTISATGAGSYTWSNGSFANAIVVNPSTNTTYSVFGMNGACTGTALTTISVNPVPVINVNNSTICIGNSATLTANGANSYTWNTGSTGNVLVVTPSVSTVYTVSGDANGCGSAAIATVVVGNGLSVNLSASSSSVCAGQSTTLQASGGTSYTWSTGNNGSSAVVTPTTNTAYTVNGSNGACSGTASISIQVVSAPPISLSVSPSNSVCLGNSATLTANGAYSLYTWSNASNGSSVVVTPSSNSTYTVTGIGAPGGCSSSTILSVFISPAPQSVLSVTNNGCGNSCNGKLNAISSGGVGPYTYSLSGSTCTSLPCTNLCSGLYTLYTKDSLNCSSFNIFSISATSNNLSSIVTTTNASCLSCNNGALSLMVSGGTAPYTYTWIPSGGNGSVAANLTPACYTVTVMDANECITHNTSCIGIATGLQSSDIDAESVSLFPNPAHASVTLSATVLQFNYAVYNALGQIILYGSTSNGSVNLAVEEFAKGIYTVECNHQQTTIRKKLVID